MAKAKETPKGKSVAEIMADCQTEMGVDIGQIGGEYEDCQRIPTGVFEFDVATGGGFPKGRVSMVYGNESSTKTVHAMLAVAQHQRLWPKQVCAYIALEGFGDVEKKWFKILGVDVEKLAVFQPTYAEQVADIMDSFCWSTDAGLVVLDSIAAMMTVTEFENSAEKKGYGGASIPISTMVRKVTAALNRSPGNPSVIYINQTRNKIGIIYGSPITMPGGNAIRFQSGMTIRMYGKNEMDAKVSKALPVAKKMTIAIEKWKVPICFASAEYMLAMVPHKGLIPGKSDWFNTFKNFAQEEGMLVKAEGKGAKGWDCFEQNWPTLKHLKDALYDDPEICDVIRDDLIQRMLDNDEIIAPQQIGTSEETEEDVT